jgi:hypothetical protein
MASGFPHDTPRFEEAGVEERSEGEYPNAAATADLWAAEDGFWEEEVMYVV